MLSLFMNKDKDKRKVDEVFIKIDRKETQDHLSTCDKIIEVDNFNLSTLNHSTVGCFNKADLDLILNYHSQRSSEITNQVGILIFQNSANKLCLVNKREKYVREFNNKMFVNYNEDIEKSQFISVSKIHDDHR
jgi:hypothetical protein